ncbi:DUF1972 domain-containing protein [Fulvivirga sp. 29W222]|uniref:DUF1972 domain-containing protein n=1 Tax=Fulvivirga marina TaxID=2494733 RepID=A0A937KEK7_9BACT|nr:DUF1972 domain-containing protein [Fulvivirga marina]MBL6449867.1 DUF1972 domain-containing protein [Fulvivirga marina]
MKNNKIAVIGTVGLPAKYGGFETLVEQLIINLGDKYSFKVYCSSKHYANKSKKYLGAELVYLPINANGKWSILYDSLSILHALFNSKVLLVLGVSGAFMLPFVKLMTSKIIITNIDGMEWKREKWGKWAKFYLKWQEKLAVKYSHHVISDNIGIKEHVQKSYDKCSTLIAYGGSHAISSTLSNASIQKYQISRRSYAFAVCRIEPENNIHVILEAFSKTHFKLLIVGNWDASKYGIELKCKYKTFSNISLLDPIYDQVKLNELRSNCGIYIHGHSAGGTNPSLVEAMWLGLPIIAFNVNYNRYTTGNKALFFNFSDDLIEILENLPSPPELNKMGKTLQNIAHQNYDWNNISKAYGKLFHP